MPLFLIWSCKPFYIIYHENYFVDMFFKVKLMVRDLIILSFLQGHLPSYPWS